MIRMRRYTINRFANCLKSAFACTMLIVLTNKK